MYNYINICLKCASEKNKKCKKHSQYIKKTIKHIQSSPKTYRKNFKCVQKYQSINPKIIFDIGANVGVYSVILNNFFPNSQIYSFEPVKMNYDILIHNIKINNITNVKTYNFGFLNKETHKMLGIPKKINISKTGWYSIFGHKNSVKCEFTTIDKWCNENNIYPNLVKIDAEGSEYLMLKSAKQCLRRCKYIVYEHNPAFKYTKKIPRLLKNKGFRQIKKFKESWNIFYENIHCN